MKVSSREFDSVIWKHGVHKNEMLKAMKTYFPNAEVKYMDLPNDSDDDVFADADEITIDLAADHPHRCANAILRKMRQQTSSKAMIAIGIAYTNEIKIIEAKEPVRVVQMRNMIKQKQQQEKQK